MGVHAVPWLLTWICISCTPCPWYCMQLWIPVVSWIFVSLYTLIYPCGYLGKNMWRPCICIVIRCWRWLCLHAVSPWLSMMWGCWLLLDSIWDPPPQWVLFYEFLVFLFCCHILLSHRLLYVPWFFLVEYELYCVIFRMCFLSLWQAAHFIAHWVFPYWYVIFY